MQSLFHTDSIIKNALDGLLHLFYPKLCAGCGRELSGREQLICLSCTVQLPVTDFYLHAGNPVEKIFWGRLPVSTASAYLYFTKHSTLQRLLHQFKYKGNTAVGRYFGRRMGELFSRCDRYNDIDSLIPLPLFGAKERKRGYNQATVLCDGIAEITGVPVFDRVVERRTGTQTQTNKNRVERWQNIEDKFELKDPEKLRGRHVLLVDDVITTGATLESCGLELLKAPGLRLSIAALAYTSL